MSRTQAPTPPFYRKSSTANRPALGDVTMRRGVFVGLMGGLIGLSACAAASVGYIFLRDEALQALSARHSSIERSYEEQISSLRRELEKVNSQRVLQEAAIGARVRELWNRQAQIEQRSSILSSLAQGRPDPSVAGQTTKAARSEASSAASRANAAPALGFAPVGRGSSSSALNALERAAPKAGHSVVTPPLPKERPALRGAFLPGVSAPSVSLAGLSLPGVAIPGVSLAGVQDVAPIGNLASIVVALDRVEQMQIGIASAVGEKARREAHKLEALAQQIGLSSERLARASVANAEGGPFIPLNLDPKGSPFDRELLRHQDDVVRADRLRRILAAAPLGRPVAARAEQTSGFGSRIDPFLGRPAYHTGVDFRETPGASVFATGPGRIVSAGSNGGYGLMVEIDHGNGISTRYAHLSAILVQEGQIIPARKTIGRVGSTGRSTGPHLHYEVRIDDDPVDPGRFLKAGAKLAAFGTTLTP